MPSSAEHMPNEVIRYIRLAEEAGFAFACLADHYHPWLEHQDQDPFIWSIIGGIAQA
jgi:coenzyme F420-dependent glucose-6-phosphate dehydrogenase